MNPAPTTRRTLALGVGLTNACNLSCAHCYRSPGIDALRPGDLLRAIGALPVRSVNFGTGENALHPEFPLLIEELARRSLRLTMTTNGYSAQALDDDHLRQFAEVEFSIDYPAPHAHDAARSPGNWALIAEQMARCSELGIRANVVAVMMSTNVALLPDIAALAGARGALLRVNAFQAVTTDAFALTYEQFWQGYRGLLAAADLVTCGEPVVRAVLGIAPTPGAGCGSETVRITPRGAVVACVYQRDADLRLADLARHGCELLDTKAFRRNDVVPRACQACPQLATCGGGCASRRALAGNLGEPDPYCPLVAGRVPPDLNAAKVLAGETLAKAASACTSVFRWRPAAARCGERGDGARG